MEVGGSLQKEQSFSPFERERKWGEGVKMHLDFYPFVYFKIRHFIYCGNLCSAGELIN